MKLHFKIISYIVIVTISFSLNLKAQEPSEELKLGLVLSGGGAKGFAHIGVLRVFEEEGIPISLITGNSIGALAGAMYSVGYSADQIEDFVKTQDWEALLSDGVPRALKSSFKKNYEQKYLMQLTLNKESKKLTLPSGLVSGNNIHNLFSGLAAALPDSMNFSDLSIPFACVAYDLSTGKEVIINQGNLPKAMLSSMSIPGVFSPVDYNGMKLVDGGIINNFPVDVAKNMGADIIIGVDLKQNDKDLEFESISQIFSEIINQMEAEKHNRNIELADVVIKPQLDDISLFSFYSEIIDSAITLGEIAAREQLPMIKRIIKDKHIIANNHSTDYKSIEEWLITDIILPPRYQERNKFITSRLHLTKGMKYTTEEIKEATRRFFAYGNFERVYFKLHPNSNGYTLELLINDKKESKAMFGAGINTTDYTALYVNYSNQNYAKLIGMHTVDAKIAINPQLNFKMETYRLPLSVVGFEVNGRFNSLQYYEMGNKLGKLDIGSSSAALYSYRRIKNIINISSGVRQSYFNSQTYNNEENNTTNANADDFFTSVYGTLTLDNRDNSYMPNKGIYLNSTLSLLFDNSDFSQAIPIYSFQFNSIIALCPTFSLSLNLYHRSLYNTTSFSPFYSNYSSNTYTSYNDFYFPTLGQSGVGFLEPISTLGELGVRIKIRENHFLTPKGQVISQVDKWENLDSKKLIWCAGISYQTMSILGPIDITFGFQDNFEDYSFYGGLGFQF